MLNTISLMGRLTKDPELRRTQSSTPVVSFTLAVERDFSDVDRRETDFIDIVAWQKTAEFVNNYFRKGQLIALVGKLQMRKWQDKNGNNRVSAEVIADRVYFAEKKEDTSSFEQAVKQNPAYKPRPAMSQQSPMMQSGFQELHDDDGELPF